MSSQILSPIKAKIIILASEFPPGPGGIGDDAFNLSEQLIDNGYEVWVVTRLREVFAKQWKAVQPRAKMLFKGDFPRQSLFTYFNLSSSFFLCVEF